MFQKKEKKEKKEKDRIPQQHLTPRQRRFALEYAATLNLSHSYRVVYDPHGEKTKTNENYAWILKKNPLVAAEIDRLLSELALTEADVHAIYAQVGRNVAAPARDRLHAADSVARVRGMMAPERVPDTRIAVQLSFPTAGRALRFGAQGPGQAQRVIAPIVSAGEGDTAPHIGGSENNIKAPDKDSLLEPYAECSTHK